MHGNRIVPRVLVAFGGSSLCDGISVWWPVEDQPGASRTDARCAAACGAPNPSRLPRATRRPADFHGPNAGDSRSGLFRGGRTGDAIACRTVR